MFERMRFWMRYGLLGSPRERQLGWREFLGAAQNFYDPWEPLSDGKLVLTPEERAVEALETARREANEAGAAAQQAEQALTIQRESYRALRAAAEQSEEPTVRAELSAALAGGREVAAAARVAAKRAAKAQDRVASLEAAQRAPLVADLRSAGMSEAEAEAAASLTWDQHRAEARWTPEERMAEQRMREAEQLMGIFTPGSEEEWARAVDDLSRARVSAAETSADARMVGAEVISNIHVAGAYAAVADRPRQQEPRVPERLVAREPEVPWYREQYEYASALKESLDASERVEEVAPQVTERPVETDAVAESQPYLNAVWAQWQRLDEAARQQEAEEHAHRQSEADGEVERARRRAAVRRRAEELKYGLGPQL